MLSSTERETQKNKERKERNQKRKDNRGAGRVSRLHDKANTSGRRRKVLWRFGLYVCWGLQSWSSLDTLNRWTKTAVYEGRLIWEQQQSAYVCVPNMCFRVCFWYIVFSTCANVWWQACVWQTAPLVSMQAYVRPIYCQHSPCQRQGSPHSRFLQKQHWKLK